MGFKKYYKQRNGLENWGVNGEDWHNVNLRIAETMAEYVDDKIKELENGKGK